LPVEAQAQQAETFIAVCTSEDVCEDALDAWGCTLRSQTKDTKAVEEREDVRWNDLINEHRSECGPKKSHSFFVRGAVEVEP
jgi:hypothetical protein